MARKSAKEWLSPMMRTLKTLFCPYAKAHKKTSNKEEVLSNKEEVSTDMLTGGKYDIPPVIRVQWVGNKFNPKYLPNMLHATALAKKSGYTFEVLADDPDMLVKALVKYDGCEKLLNDDAFKLRRISDIPKKFLENYIARHPLEEDSEKIEKMRQLVENHLRYEHIGNRNFASETNMIRIMALYNEGGIYADTDIPFKIAETVFDGSFQKLSSKTGFHLGNSFNNDLMASTPFHQIPEELLETAAENYHKTGQATCDISLKPFIGQYSYYAAKKTSTEENAFHLVQLDYPEQITRLTSKLGNILDGIEDNNQNGFSFTVRDLIRLNSPQSPLLYDKNCTPISIGDASDGLQESVSSLTRFLGTRHHTLGAQVFFNAVEKHCQETNGNLDDYRLPAGSLIFPTLSPEKQLFAFSWLRDKSKTRDAESIPDDKWKSRELFHLMSDQMEEQTRSKRMASVAGFLGESYLEQWQESGFWSSEKTEGTIYKKSADNNVNFVDSLSQKTDKSLKTFNHF
jgi:hypothetical protein